MEDLTEVNEAAGTRRAQPAMYLKLKPLVAQLDAVILRRAFPVAEVDRAHDSDLFRNHLTRLCESAFLSEPEKRHLQMAIERSSENSSGLLRFGDVYHYLVKKRRYSPRSDLIQWCRAAHVLTVPSDLRIAPSSSDQDLAPHQAAFILGYSGRQQSVDTRHWFQRFPRKILTGDILDELTFDDIVRLRKIGVSVGYFSAFAAVQDSYGSPSFDKTFLLYLRALEEYLIAIGLSLRLNLSIGSGSSLGVT